MVSPKSCWEKKKIVNGITNGFKGRAVLLFLCETLEQILSFCIHKFFYLNFLKIFYKVFFFSSAAINYISVASQIKIKKKIESVLDSGTHFYSLPCDKRLSAHFSLFHIFFLLLFFERVVCVRVERKMCKHIFRSLSPSLHALLMVMLSVIGTVEISF